MPTPVSGATLISVEEYLVTSYRPDCDYVDGHIEERNLGEYDHARLQTAITIYFGSRQKQLGITVVVEQRVQVSPTRFRVPDVCVILGKTSEQIFRTAPFLCIEVLSPEDRMKRVEERSRIISAWAFHMCGCWTRLCALLTAPLRRRGCAK